MSIEQKPPVKKPNQSILVKNDRLKSFYAPHHYHQDYEIIYIKKSQGIRVVGNSIDNYKSGEVVILGPRLPHYHVASIAEGGADYPIETIAVLFPEALFESNKSFPEFSFLESVLDAMSYGIELQGTCLSEACKTLESMTLEPSYQNFKALFDILSSLHTSPNAYRRLSTVKYDNMRQYDARMKGILEYIYTHFQSKLKVGGVARHAGMSLSGFSVYFKAQTKHTFSQYLNLLRISKACELLASTPKSISEIAYETGYENLAYFNRKFKEIKKQAPKEFRANIVVLH